MDQIIKIACDYLSFLYDCKYEEKNNLLFIYGDYSVFKFDFNDKKRFNCYTLFHKNYSNNKGNFHVQLRSKSIFSILLNAFGHDFYKNNGIFTYKEDTLKFKEDIFKIRDNLVTRNKLLQQKTIICPFCGRKLTVKNKDGDIRYTIHCRCKFNKHTTKLFYYSNKGYDYIKPVIF